MLQYIIGRRGTGRESRHDVGRGGRPGKRDVQLAILETAITQIQSDVTTKRPTLCLIAVDCITDTYWELGASKVGNWNGVVARSTRPARQA